MIKQIGELRFVVEFYRIQRESVLVLNLTFNDRCCSIAFINLLLVN